jgi:hypothetical protein
MNKLDFPPSGVRGPLSYKNIKPLLITGKNTFSKWTGYIGLGIGVLLL